MHIWRTARVWDGRLLSNRNLFIAVTLAESGLRTFPCTIPNSREFSQKKNELRFVRRIFTNSRQSHCIDVCVFVFLFSLNDVKASMRTHVVRSRRTAKSSIEQAQNHVVRTPENVCLLFRNDLWCLHGANSVRLGLFICLVHAHCWWQNIRCWFATDWFSSSTFRFRPCVCYTQ